MCTVVGTVFLFSFISLSFSLEYYNTFIALTLVNRTEKYMELKKNRGNEKMTNFFRTEYGDLAPRNQSYKRHAASIKSKLVLKVFDVAIIQLTIILY